MIISWITPDEVGSSMVLYWAEDSKVKKSANSTVVTYKYYDYSSGYIHHCIIKNLEVSSEPCLVSPFLYVNEVCLWFKWICIS